MGIVGVYFVLRRYLLKNRAPEAVLIVGTPEYLRYVPEGFLGHYYLASTFREDFEVDWLRENAPSLVPVFWKPAIFSIYDDVIAPLSGIIRSANRKSIFGDEPVHSFDATVFARGA